MTTSSNIVILIHLLLVSNSFGYAAKLLGEIKRVEALLGGRVMMPCDVTPENSNDTLLLLVWYKGSKPFYSYDGRLVKHWRSGDFFQNDRIIFTFHTEPASLLLDRVTLDDEGTYRCRADFNLSPTRNSGIYLYVIIVPSKPFFMDEIGMKVENKVGPLHEGDTLLLICLAVGGKPIPKLTWWNSHTLLDSTDEPSEVPGVRENQLMLTLTREYAGSKIQCLASNNNITVPLSSSLDIELYVSPETVTILSSKQALSAGKLYELPCYVNGSYPLPNVSWWLNGKIITDQQIVTESTRNEIISNLHFRPRIEHNGMDLTCLATNAVMAPNHASKLHTIRLNIFFAPLLSLTLLIDKRESDFIEEGQTIQLRCMVEANPWITNTEWFANNRTIQGSYFNGSQITLTSSDLLIFNTSLKHSGKYTCMAFNLEGSGRSNELEIQISYKPICIKQNMTHYDNVTNMQCPISAFPQATKFYWKITNHNRSNLNESVFDDEVNLFKLDLLENSTKTNYQEEVNVLCWAVNSIGEQIIPCRLMLKRPKKIPNPPSGCKVDASENALTVKCIPADTLRSLDWLLGVSIWQNVNKTKVLINNITSPLSKVKIDNLKEGQSYELLLYVFNKWGESETVKLSAETINSSNLNNNVPIDIGMLSGVIVGMILTFSVLIILFILRRKSKSSIIDTGQNEKNDSSFNKKKQTFNVSVNADLTNKPLLYKNGLSISTSILPSMNNTEPKNCEDINLVQMKGDEFIMPPPISRDNKPRILSANNCNAFNENLPKNKFKNIRCNRDAIKSHEALTSADDNPSISKDNANLKLFTMSKESIV